jgi:GNAT superfamily N-acetyltransferase
MLMSSSKLSLSASRTTTPAIVEHRPGGLRMRAIYLVYASRTMRSMADVAVDPGLAGRGLGRALTEFAEVETRRRGYDEIRLYTHETMTESIAMYHHLGWQETPRGEQSGYSRVFFCKPLT